MGFGKLVFGFFLVGIGLLFLGATFGVLPAIVWPWLARFWPLLLLTFGLALLASTVKNFALGMFSFALLVGTFVFGGFWISEHLDQAAPVGGTAIDLRKSAVHQVALQGRVLMSSFSIAADPAVQGKLLVATRDVLGRRTTSHEWGISRGSGNLTWPSGSSGRGSQPDSGRHGGGIAGLLGSGIDVRLPSGTPLRLNTSNYFSFGTADLTGLGPASVDIHAVSSSVRILAGARPTKIHISGFLSNLDVRLPASCPARLEYSSLFTWHSVPEDFLEHVSARVKGRAAYWTAIGKGAPVTISVTGPFMRLHVTREPVKAL